LPVIRLTFGESRQSVNFHASLGEKDGGIRMRPLMLGFAFSALALSSASASPVGLWRAKDGAEIRIANCGAALCGHVTKARIDQATGKPARDRLGRPLTGVQIIRGMRPDGAGRWTGQLYNEQDGNLYLGHLLELGPSRVRIEGCALGICGGEELSRVN
jgi:uncharacterized protein (DUF2147 family)